MIDFFASITVASIAVMTIVILISNYRQAQILGQVREVLEEWYQSHMRDRLEKHENEIVIEEPLDWFGHQVGLKLLQLNQVLTEPTALEFLTAQGSRLVVSNVRPTEFKRKLRSKRVVRGKASRLMEPLLGRRPRKVRIIHKSPENSGEWFNIKGEAALRALNLDWGDIWELWFYIVPVETKQAAKKFSVDLSRVRLWFILKKEAIGKWFKRFTSKSSS